MRISDWSSDVCSSDLHSTGGKTRLGGISKQGDRYLRRLLVVGATAVMRHIKDKPTPMADWIRKLSEKKPFRVVSVALRSEEHTSELQSLMRISYAVFCLKKKTIQIRNSQE